LQVPARTSFVRAALLICCLSAPPQAGSQVLYGSIVGAVTDSSSSAVPTATVEIHQRETGQSRHTLTNQNGGFQFSTLSAGTYDVKVTKSGFQGMTFDAVPVTVDQTARVDATLHVGAVTESIQVSAAQEAILQTDSAEVRSEIDTRSLQDLPVPVNRDFENLLVTVPGFTPPANQNSVAANPSRGLTFSVNGGTRNSNNIRIDGASATNVWLAEVAGYVPGLEAIETVSVVTGSFDQAQGLAGGAAVNVHIKSGTNSIHGSAFEYAENKAFTARPFFAPPSQVQPKNINNDLGGIVGGPIIRNKLFYFVSWDGNFIRQNSGVYDSVPTAAIRAGNMSGSPNPIYDPMTGSADGTNRTPFTGNIVPTSRISPIALKLAAIEPLPNIPNLLANNYYATGNYDVDRNTTDAKVDYHITDKLSVTARLGWLKYNILDPPAFGDNGPGVASGRAGHGFGNVFSGTVSATYIVRPNLIIDTLFSATQIGTNSEVPKLDENLGLEFGIPGTNGPSRAYGGYPQISVSNYTDIGNAGSSGGPIYYDDRQYQYSANASWIKGRHNIRFGFEAGYQDLNHFDTGSAPGHLTFNGGVTVLNGKGAPSSNQFNSYASFLLGYASSAVKDILPFDGSRDVVRMPTYRLYFQDQWQAMSKLTVSYGLGWNDFPMGSRANSGLERYNFANNQVELCGVAGNPHDCGYNISKKNFSPNLGLAFRPTKTLVLRAGYGINFDPETFAYNRDMITNYPYDLSLNLTAASTYQYATTLAAGIPAIVVPTTVSSGYVTLPPSFSVGSLPQHTRRDYVQSWNFTLQKQLLWGFVAQTAYVGTRGVDIPQQLNQNYGQVGGGTASERYNQLYGNTASIYLLTPVNHTHYDGLQTSLSRRFAQGVSFGMGYTFARNSGICCNDDADGTPAIQIPQYFNLNRALAPTDRTNNFNLSAVAELPFGKGKPWVHNGGLASAIAGGWQTSALFTDYSGTPFSVAASNTSLNAPSNTQRADQVKSSVAILGGTGPGQPYFDPLAFAPVTAVRFGTAGFNTVRGPGTVNLDLSLFRSFRFRDRYGIQFRAEAFNLTNTPHFANPGASVSSATFNADGSIKSLGSYTIISATTGTGREGIDQRAMRFGLRLSF
jgi:hypothetical protein